MVEAVVARWHGDIHVRVAILTGPLRTKLTGRAKVLHKSVREKPASRIVSHDL